MYRTLFDIKEAMKEVEALPIKPDFDRPKDEDVIDEDKSVKWNREEVASLQMVYDDAFNHLREVKKERKTKLLNELYESIQHEVGNITISDARRIYEYAYEESHAYGYNEVFITLENLIGLIQPIVNNIMK